ncbi:sensor domain-containing phosphodiesterase [Alkalibacillus salilacus]|uniref:EAL domain-containing protein (Putative c-di-GMP-specific phosphodiesterase class I) n=1 Tax=Alkalibacillus salilacus TaxID=284582 RepID=A0ABT9VB28_9BACI|nr:EAL domain-containing protein [Alkalibacillus salilacus]MDQ0158144.1 EAL domain-containing protein (putative c-di-GMP-specific phosphodiesterase class I) [Alkalibacillus salilacus]
MGEYETQSVGVVPDKFVQGYEYITEHICDGAPLKDILKKLVKYFEDQFESSKASIMLLNETGDYFVDGITYSFPEALLHQYYGVPLQDGIGVSGHAVSRKSLSVSSNIDNDPYWDNWRQIVNELGIQSCWSLPVMRHESDDVIGALTVYSSDIKEPTDEELKLVEAYKALLSLIMNDFYERHSGEESGIQSEPMLPPKSLSEREKYLFMIRRGLEEGQIRPHYQPIMNKSGDVYGFEVLVRWPHPERGVIPPNQFIPFAEEEGLIDEIDQYVAEYACREMKSLIDQTGQNFMLTINVSANHITKRHFIEKLKRTLEKTGFPPSLLAVELTETTLLNDMDDAIYVMDRLRELGVQLWIDDFGTVYSSLNYLKKLPVDVVKLDGSFVREIHQEMVDRMICESIVRLAHNLNLQVVAEGIEDESQLNVLSQMDCEWYQGYYYQKPIHFNELQNYVQTVNWVKRKGLA